MLGAKLGVDLAGHVLTGGRQQHWEAMPAEIRRGEYRLVLYQTVGGAEGSLFPSDAGAYTPALSTFSLSPDQELPTLPPGASVYVDTEPAEDSAVVIHAGDVVIRPAGPLKRGRGRIFAERGSSWPIPRRSVGTPPGGTCSNSSISTVSEWEHKLRSHVKQGWLTTAVLAVSIVVVVVSLALGKGFPAPVYLGGGWSMAAALRAWRRARRSQQALSAAREAVARPCRPMRMSLKWTVGHGDGPRARATLYPPRGHLVPVAEVAVMNVPVGFSPAAVMPVQVVGDPDHPPSSGRGAWSSGLRHDPS